jgi:hypothetical protein
VRHGIHAYPFKLPHCHYAGLSAGKNFCLGQRWDMLTWENEKETRKETNQSWMGHGCVIIMMRFFLESVLPQFQIEIENLMASGQSG